MANILPLEKQTMVIHALAEGNSIRSIERMTNMPSALTVRDLVELAQ
jgi:hypothetical protein